MPWRSEDRFPFVLHFDTRYRWVVSFTKGNFTQGNDSTAPIGQEDRWTPEVSCTWRESKAGRLVAIAAELLLFLRLDEQSTGRTGECLSDTRECHGTQSRVFMKIYFSCAVGCARLPESRCLDMMVRTGWKRSNVLEFYLENVGFQFYPKIVYSGWSSQWFLSVPPGMPG
jgi:hypothetical protein